MGRLVALEATGQAFVDELRRTWDQGDAVLPVDPRLPASAAADLVAALGAGEAIDDGDALVVATSGTTGAPRGVVLTHSALAASAEATSARLGVDPSSDRWLACLPLAHVGGLSVVLRALHTGTPFDVHDGFDAALVDAAARAGTTLVSLVPTALGRIDAAAFRMIVLGGSALPGDLPANVVTTYGLTETGSGVVYDGVPLDGVDVRVDEIGEIALRGPMLFRAYRDGTDPKDADGWFRTGDVGAYDGSVLTVHGRADDLIVTGGENVWPDTVEAALATHPAVADVAVVGRPDAEWGTRVVAVVVPVDPSSPPRLEDLRAWAKQRLPAYAAPKDVDIVAALPRTALGKVKRARLRPSP
jgi:O-succinylbenzoic acid--CoA ligase